MIKIAARSGNALGESVLWHAGEAAVYWLDVLQPRLHRLDPATGELAVRDLQVAPPLGAIVAAERSGKFVLAHAAGLSLLDPASGRTTLLGAPEGGRVGIAYNDAKVDRWGRLWVGSFDLREEEPRGALWCLPPGGSPVMADCGFAVSNGPAVSPDGRTLYFSDSVARRILAYDIGPDDPRPSGRRVFAALAPEEGVPDGLTVDAEGGLWVAHWDGWRVTRYTPEGERDLVIPLLVPRVTSLAFGGPDLATLFITTARDGLAPAVARAAPDAGHLFALASGHRGLPERPFAIAD